MMEPWLVIAPPILCVLSLTLITILWCKRWVREHAQRVDRIEYEYAREIDELKKLSYEQIKAMQEEYRRSVEELKSAYTPQVVAEEWQQGGEPVTFSDANIEAIYQKLLENHADAQVMVVLADALEETGQDRLALAYRWAAAHEKWPFEKEWYRENRKVWDWDSEGRAMIQAPPPSRLPTEFYHAIRKLDNKKYGTVNDAFVLLGRVL